MTHNISDYQITNALKMINQLTRICRAMKATYKANPNMTIDIAENHLKDLCQKEIMDPDIISDWINTFSDNYDEWSKINKFAIDYLTNIHFLHQSVRKSLPKEIKQIKDFESLTKEEFLKLNISTLSKIKCMDLMVQNMWHFKNVKSNNEMKNILEILNALN